MKRRMKYKSVACAIGCLAVVVLSLLIPAQPRCEDVTPKVVPVQVNPYRIILSAKGRDQEIQCIISMPIPAGYKLTGGSNVILLFEGIEVGRTSDVRYCVLDENLIASFDRKAIQDEIAKALLSNVGSWVNVVAKGSISIASYDGDHVTTLNFIGYTRVQILDTGKAPKS